MLYRRRLPQEELIPAPGGTSFFAVRRRASHWPFAWHQHAACELTWILRGHGRRHVGSSVESFSAGDLILLGPRLPHTWVSEPKPGTTVEAIVIQFAGDFLGTAWERIAELAPVAALLLDAERGLVLPLQAEEDLRSLVTMPMGPIRLATLIRVLGTLAAGNRRALLTAPARAQRRADHWARLVDDATVHPERVPPQAVAARRVGLAPSAFARAFRQRFGLPYRDWRIRIRLELACRQLSDTQDPITTVALNAGFTSLSAFNRQFRAALGTTPRTWRSRITDEAMTP
jgi:AraC-like DNA-binding protein